MQKAKDLGVRCILTTTRTTSFRGVGRAQSSGMYTLPGALKLEESGLVIPGPFQAHEVPDEDHPMLISQSAQAKLGFIKDFREGTITIKDYNNQHLEVVRRKGTGLFMIRLDHLRAEQHQMCPGELPKLVGSDAHV